MTDWAKVRSADFAVPSDRPQAELVAELSAMLRSPDPVVREGQAYSILETWIRWGRLGQDQLRALGEEMVARFGDTEIQARTSALRILDAIVSTGFVEPSWVPPFERWYVAEEDLRSYDEKLGRLQAVVHGADLLGRLGLNPAVEPVEMLRLGIGRLLTPTDHMFRNLEDDHLGYALAATLTRAGLTEADATEWLDPAARALAVAPTDGFRAEFANTLRTLRVVYVMIDQGVRLRLTVTGQQTGTQVPHREAVRTKLVEVFRAATPYYF